MNTIQRRVGVTAVSISLILSTGCDTPSGALVGGALGAVAGGVIGKQTGNEGAGILAGALIGGIAGGIIGRINEQQRAQLQKQSPRTLRTIKHNDEVVAQQKKARQSSEAPAKAPALARFTVDDIKALNDASVKPGVIVDEIKKSKSTYSQADIASAEEAHVDPSVIRAMKQNA